MPSWAARTTEEELEGGDTALFLYSGHIHFFWQRYIGGFCMWCCCIDLLRGRGLGIPVAAARKKNDKIRRFSHRKNKCKRRKLSVRHTVTLTWEFESECSFSDLSRKTRRRRKKILRNGKILQRRLAGGGGERKGGGEGIQKMRFFPSEKYKAYNIVSSLLSPPKVLLSNFPYFECTVCSIITSKQTRTPSHSKTTGKERKRGKRGRGFRGTAGWGFGLGWVGGDAYALSPTSSYLGFEGEADCCKRRGGRGENWFLARPLPPREEIFMQLFLFASGGEKAFPFLCLWSSNYDIFFCSFGFAYM